MVKNIVFDMGNVLLAYDPARYAERLPVRSEAARAVLRELFYGPEWALLDAGALTEREALERVTGRIPQYAEEVRLAMRHWPDMLRPVPGMTEIVSDLKAGGFGIYLLSNTSLRFYQYYRDVEIFRRFDGFMISAREKLLKPDPALFRRFCTRFRLLPKECLFLDDRPENVDSAVSCGMAGHCFSAAEELRAFLKSGGIL